MQTGDINHLSDAVFFSGCSRRCIYCHNPDVRCANCGTEMTVQEIVDSCPSKWVCLMGGEPLDNDILDMMILINEFHSAGKKVVLFTSRYIPIMLHHVDHYHYHIVDNSANIIKPEERLLRKLSFAYVSYRSTYKKLLCFPDWANSVPIYIRKAIEHEEFSTPEKDAKFLVDMFGFEKVFYEGEKVVVS